MARSGIRIGGYTLACFGAISFAIATRAASGLALVQLGPAIATAMLVGLPRRRWPHALLVVGAAAAMAAILGGLPTGIIAWLSVLVMVESGLAAALLIALRPGRDWLDNIGGLAALILASGLAAPLVTSLPAGLVTAQTGTEPWHFYALNWLIAHGLGAIIGFPTAYLAASLTRAGLCAQLSARRGLELVAHAVFVGVVTELAIRNTVYPLLFLPIAPLVLATFRCGREGATLAMAVFGVIVALAVHQPETRFAIMPVAQTGRVFFAQFYVATTSLMVLAASVALRHHALLLAELERRKALKRLIADNSDDALLNLDPRGIIRFASPAGERMTGRATLEGEHLATFFDYADAPLVEIVLAEAAAAPESTQAFERSVAHAGSHRWLEAKLRAVASGGKLQGFAVTIRDVTERKTAELEALRAAETDTLTGLPNRRALLARLEARLARAEAQPFTLAIVDLDHFKHVNDTHGHIAGDAVLRAVGELMAGMSRHGQLFTRLGGEEFALLSYNPDLAAVGELCEDLRETIARLRFDAPEGGQFQLTASIGAARIDRVMSTGEALESADRLLYAAKNLGRDCVITSLPPQREPLRLIA